MWKREQWNHAMAIEDAWMADTGYPLFVAPAQPYRAPDPPRIPCIDADCLCNDTWAALEFWKKTAHEGYDERKKMAQLRRKA